MQLLSLLLYRAQVGSNTHHEIEWGLQCNGGSLSVVEGGVTKASVGSYTQSSVLEVLINSDPGVLQRTARLIEYWRDGEMLYESESVPTPTQSLLLDVACHAAISISEVRWKGENLWRWAEACEKCEACGESTSGSCAAAIDTKLSTFVSFTELSGSWISFDLGSWKSVSGLKMRKPTDAGTAGIQAFKVQVGESLSVNRWTSHDEDDGWITWDTWKLAGSFSSAQSPPDGVEDFDFEPVTARYLRIFIDSNHGDSSAVKLWSAEWRANDGGSVGVVYNTSDSDIPRNTAVAAKAADGWMEGTATAPMFGRDLRNSSEGSGTLNVPSAYLNNNHPEPYPTLTSTSEEVSRFHPLRKLQRLSHVNINITNCCCQERSVRRHLGYHTAGPLACTNTDRCSMKHMMHKYKQCDYESGDNWIRLKTGNASTDTRRRSQDKGYWVNGENLWYQDRTPAAGP